MVSIKRICPKLINNLSDCRGWTLVFVMMSFLPVIAMILVLGLQSGNNPAAFKQSRNDTQALYAAEMGIERYKNEIKSDSAYSGILTFTKVIDGISYDVEVTSVRLGIPERVRITSTIADSGITAERTITVSRISP